MNAGTRDFKYRTITILVFCCYIFWDFFGIDMTMTGGDERIPFHRVFIFMTLVLFFVNFKIVAEVLTKSKLFLCLVFYVLLSVAWSADPKATLMIFIFLLSSLLIAVITAVAFYDRHNKFIAWLFTLTFLMVLASIFVALKYPKLGVNSSDFAKVRWIGITNHPNKLGGLVLISIWCSVNLFFSEGGFLRKAISSVAIAAAMYAVIMADSMTSIVASFVVAISMFYFRLLGRASASFKIVLFVVMGLGFLITTTFYMNSEEIVNKSLASGGRDTTFTGRSALWERGVQSFFDSPLIGHGFDNLDGLTQKYGIRMSHLHNGYIEVIAKGGGIAIVLLFLIILKNFRYLMVVKNVNPGLFAFLATGFLGVLVHNLAESSYLRGLNGLNLMFMLISSFLVVSVNSVDMIRKNR